MPTTPIRKSPSAEAMVRKWGTPAEIRAWEAQKAERGRHPSGVEVIRVKGKTQLRSRSTGKIIAEQG